MPVYDQQAAEHASRSPTHAGGRRPTPLVYDPLEIPNGGRV